MLWSGPGLRGVLALRTLLRGGGWDHWWAQHPIPLPPPAEPLAA